VEKQLGVKPIIYTNQHFFERHLAGHFDDYPLWIARYSTDKPSLNSGKQWDIWQFSNEGCVDGISKKVDLNVFPGTSEMLERLCWYPPSGQDADSGNSIP
jgi:lysozyme